MTTSPTINISVEKLSTTGLLIRQNRKIAYINRHLEEILGYAPYELSDGSFNIIEDEASIAALENDPHHDYPHIAHANVALLRKDKTRYIGESTIFDCEWEGEAAIAIIFCNTTPLNHQVSKVSSKNKLNLSEKQFRQIIDLVPQAIFIKDRSGRFLLANKAKADLYNTEVEKLTGALQSDIHPDKKQAARILKTDISILDSNTPKIALEETFIDQLGQEHILHIIKMPLIASENKASAVLGVATDITERKQIEDALKRSEERLRNSLKYTNIGNWEWDIQTDSFYWSECMSFLYGFELSAMQTNFDIFLNAVHMDDKERVLKSLKHSLTTGRDYSIEYRISEQNGLIRWVHQAGGVVRDENGNAIRMLGIAQAITQRKLAEQALAESEEKYRVVMENASDAILLGDLKGWIVDANRRAELLLGYTRDELLQMHVTEIHPQEDHPILEAAFSDLANSGNSLYDHLVKRKNGEIIHAEVAATSIILHGKKMAMAIFRDTTARKRAEEERLTHAKTQRDILVKEVHHRIKNNLQGVVGLLRQHATKNPELGPALEAAINQVNTIAIVHGLYGQENRENIILCDLVRAISGSAQKLAGITAEFPVIIEVKQAIRVLPDEAVPLALILNELIFNAIKHHHGDPGEISVSLRHYGNCAKVSIRNPNMRLPDGFNFYTEQGLGTGLKLVKSLLPNHGCKLQLTNNAQGVLTELSLSPPVILPRLPLTSTYRDSHLDRLHT